MDRSDGTPAGADAVTSGFGERQGDMAGATVGDGDWTTSDEAMAVLREQGVEAWQAWCEEHRPRG